jgi:hypothetical protein
VATTQPLVSPAGPRPSQAKAEIWLWVAFAFAVAGFGIGTGWDRRWHTTHPFEDFFSPPHLFIYTNTLLAAAVIVYVTFNTRLRRAFGAGYRLPWPSFEVPGALMLLGGGFVVVGLGGLFDGIWHTAFGLDETSWSLPHSMLGHGILLVALGFVAGRLALNRPWRWYAVGLLAWLVLAVAPDLIGGPILRNPPPNGLRAVAALPVLAADAAFQHTTRIYLAWHLDRTNWLYLPMISLTMGFALRLAQRLTGPRDRWLVALSSVGALVAVVSGEAGGTGWVRVLLAPPLLPAALGYALARRVGVRSLWAWAGAGWGACLAGLIWTHDPLLALVFGPLAVGGAWLAERVLSVVESPTRRTVITTACVIGLLLPAISGVADLYFRMHTP